MDIGNRIDNKEEFEELRKNIVPSLYREFDRVTNPMKPCQENRRHTEGLSGAIVSTIYIHGAHIQGKHCFGYGIAKIDSLRRGKLEFEQHSHAAESIGQFIPELLNTELIGPIASTFLDSQGNPKVYVMNIYSVAQEDIHD